MNAADYPNLTMAQALERLAEMPRVLERAITGRTPEQLRRQPGPELFSLVEHACHLRDLEREGYLVRVRRILAEERPELPGFDGGAVAAARDYPSQDARVAADEFAQARAELIARVGALPAATLSREALFGGERITLCGLLAMMAGHDAEHRAEIERLAADLDAR